MVRTGSVTEMKDASGEKRKTVVFKHDPDKGAVTVIDVKTRKRKTVGSLQPSHVTSETRVFCYCFVFVFVFGLYSLIDVGRATVLHIQLLTSVSHFRVALNLIMKARLAAKFIF